MSENKSSDDSNSNTGDNTNTGAVVVNNRFANDGSFLEMFKQMQKNMNCIQTNNSCDSKSNQKSDDSSKPTNLLTEIEAQEVEDTIQSNSSSKKSFVNINKRKPKTLKTGLIKKQKNEDSDEEESGVGPNDAWNRYMKEVRKYKEKYGDDNDKNRPLVK